MNHTQLYGRVVREEEGKQKRGEWGGGPSDGSRQ